MRVSPYFVGRFVTRSLPDVAGNALEVVTPTRTGPMPVMRFGLQGIVNR